jgi:hypothetical protein
VIDPDFDDEDDLDEDPWAETTDYGYADGTIIGNDAWEDQAGMLELKASLKIPDDWYLVKVVNFYLPGRSLREMEEWLAQNCLADFKRVGWTSGCSTKVGVAFENGNDAFFFKMRWR